MIAQRMIVPGLRVCRVWLCVSVLLGLIVPRASGQAADNAAILSAWLNAQTNIQTWEADFVQTRNLKTLTQPLTASGHVWFHAPNRFRWEIRAPTRSIAVREPDQMLVLYPKLKYAERYPLDAGKAGPWKDTLSLLDAGFPRSRDEVESRFSILSQTTADGVHALALRPKSETARRIMPQITIGIDAANYTLRSTELQFTDGSTMQNAFTNAVMNGKIDESVFHPELGADWKITEPFKGK
jgi:outer membrane lipoprotein-sorting protein